MWPFKFGRLLSGKTVGIVGFGNIGSDLFELLNHLDVKLWSMIFYQKIIFLKKS